jgi:leucyl aminopeptidase (aminopeptidase T)
VAGVFGGLSFVTPLSHVNGNGHGEHVKLSFVNGFVVELSAATAAELARRIPEALAALSDPDCSGACADLEER